MKCLSINSIGRLAGNRSWTCSNCRTQPLVAHIKTTQRSLARQYATGSSHYSKRPPKPRARATVLTAAATAATGAGVLAFTDDIKYGYDATERAGRVAAALAICINEYVYDIFAP